MFFLTLVLVIGAEAAPLSEEMEILSPRESQNEPDRTPSSTQPNLIEQNSLSITPVEVKRETTKKASFFYPFLQSISPRLFLIADLDLLRDGQLPYGLGVSYLVPQLHQPQWEVGADLFSNSNGQISVSLRQIYFADNYFRPYIKLGLGHIWRAEEKLASFSNWKNYLLRAGIGFEDVIKIPMSARIEVEAALGTETSFFIMSLGYSWGW